MEISTGVAAGKVVWRRVRLCNDEEKENSRSSRRTGCDRSLSRKTGYRQIEAGNVGGRSTD